MKRLLSVAAILALAAARPEVYKETEDFQYARSSTDEGSKSGYYGAQRGNVGGNYERAHNMDSLAQNQMSGLVRQVEGELGDGSKTRTGSVYSAANSRGVYGSGHYDLSNLQGRNFQEGVSYGDSQSHSSLSSHNAGYASQSSSAMHSSGHNSHSQSLGYSGRHGSNRQSLQASNIQQAAENVQDAAAYGYGQQATNVDSRYHSQSGYHSQSEYDSQNTNLHSSSHSGVVPQHRLILTTPVRVVGRPGSRVAIPVGVQTYDATHSASVVDQNAIASDAEVLHNVGQQTNYRPTNNAKRYESSYSYRKQWEKHDVKPEVVPLAIPTENPFVNTNSELYDDTQSLQSSNSLHQDIGSAAHTSHSSGIYNGYNSQSQSSLSSHSGYQAGAESHHKSSTSGLNSNAYTQGAYNAGSHNSDAMQLQSGLVDATNIADTVGTKPKSYQSSYSYHKSWERQGDPYVIKPASGAYVDQASQRLTDAAASNSQYSSHQYGTKSHQGYHSYSNNGALVDCDCDDDGHVRVARSYNSVPNQYGIYKQGQEYDTSQDLAQQAQVTWGQSEDLSQHSQIKWENLEDLGQQTQNQWQNVEDIRQHSQNQWDNVEDLGQQTQNSWDKLTNAEQETQNNWDKVEDLGQQTQNSWDKLTNVEQETQNKWDKVEDLGQQTENKWDSADLGQQTQNTWDNLHVEDTQTDLGQQTQDIWSKVELASKPNKVEDQRIQMNDTGSAWVGEVKDYKNPWDMELDEKQKTDIVQVTPPDFDKEFIAKLNKDFASDFNQNNRDDQSIWDTTYLYGLPNQEQSDYMGQEVQSTWGVLEFLDQHKTEIIPEKPEDKLSKIPIEGRIPEEKPVYSYFDHSYAEVVKESNYQDQKNHDWGNSDQSQDTFGNLWNKINIEEIPDIETTTTYKMDIVVSNEQSKNISSTWGQESNDFEAHRHWISNILNKTSTTSTSTTTTTTTKVTSPTPITVSSTRSKNRNNTKFNTEDIGRGDIGPEEIIPEITSEKPKSNIVIDDIQTENSKPHDIGVIGLFAGNNESQSELTNNQTDSSLNVISLNKWLQTNKEEEDRLKDVLSITTSTLKPVHVTEGSYSLSNSVEQKINNNSYNNIHNLLDASRTVPTDSADQQIQLNQNIALQSIYQENQKTYDPSEQQSETVWGQSLEDYLREPKTNDKPQLAENFGLSRRENQNFDRIYQETETQQVEHFEILEQGKRDNFYNESSNLPSYQQQLQDNQKGLETSIKREDVQHSKNVVSVPTTTEKTGFWKSVGNKFSNAKDKVSSWFRRS